MDNTDFEVPTLSCALPLRLTSLPPELKHAIYICLPDVSSAKALALTSSSFYHTFLDIQARVIPQILEKKMDPEMLRDSLAALKVSRIQIWSKKAVLKVLIDLFGRSHAYKSHAWNLSDALAASKIHDCIEFFATKFASSALSENPTARGAVTAAPSSNEMRRIKIALHRYELYCNLFRYPSHHRMVRDKVNRNRLIRPDTFSTREQQEIFLDRFSFWEIEQLGCIHDFLMQEMTIPFTDVAKHDVAWGANCVPYLDNDLTEKVHKEPRLTRGLEYLYRLVTADSYDARLKILDEHDPTPRGSPYCNSRLPDVFRYRLEDDEQLYLRPNLSSDHDRGPSEAWRWAHSESSMNQFYFRRNHRILRQRGYVMWDLKRLDDWGMIDTPVEDLVGPHVPYFLEDCAWTSRHWLQERSWKERSYIWREGGRGWWAPGDESQIQWYEELRVSRIQEQPEIRWPRLVSFRR